MAKHLVIVESPAKAKTINKFLGRDYIVKASMGHIRDLPKSKLGVDVEGDFTPQYVNSRDKSKVIKELRDAAKKCEDVILAPDPDREGEAIAWHLRELLKKEMKGEENFRRVTYNQITKPAILKAFSEPTAVDMHKVDAQQARRVLDRIVGYQVSPLLWRRIRGGSSAGRVQTVALRLVCEREKEILAFIPETYWIFGASVSKQVDPKTPFQVRLLRLDGEKAEVRTPELAKEITEDLQARKLSVAKIARKEVSRKAPPPFITSTLQQAASSALGYQPNRTMSLAQKLYEGVKLDGEGETGLITYMRTDSVHLADEAIQETRKFIESEYGSEFLPEKPTRYKSRGSAQEAHEAIRPTDPSRTPDDLRGVLDEAELKLYRLIWARTVACQMAPAKIAQLSIDIGTDSEKHEYLFRASASEIVFPGYMKVSGKEARSDDDPDVDALPPLKEGEALDVQEWLPEEKQTQPPKRFSEAALIRSLEENGVGRPSTYASIISVLYSREYVEREARSLRPTRAGMEVFDFLVSRLPTLFDVKFTANMEEQLDEIEGGSVSWTKMMETFYADFVKWVEEAKVGKVDMAEVEALLGFTSAITKFAPPVKRGRRTYSDETFTTEMAEAKEKGDTITDRQVDNLKKVVARYADQIAALTEEKIAELDLAALIEKEKEQSQPARPETLKKLELLLHVEYDEPRKVGKRTYDDKKFGDSLREQVEGGKRLSENQVKYLDRLVIKYSAQIDGFEEMKESLAIDDTPEEDNESGPLLELLGKVTEWAAPTKRGKREWSDEEFYQSLSGQFRTKKALSPRQRGAMKKMITRYRAQIPEFEEKREELGLPEPRAPKAKKK